jgi:hypothetical protein
MSLMWHSEQINDIERRNGAPISRHYDPYFRLDMPPNCQLPPFVEPPRNVSDPIFRANLRSYLKFTPLAGDSPLPSLMGDLDTPQVVDEWQYWQQIEPNFRSQAESEMYEQHYQLLWVRARLAWWQSNAGTIESCIEAARPRPLTPTQSASLSAEVVNENTEIDRKWDQEIKNVRETRAPPQAKPETIDRLEGLKEIEKYEHDMDRSEKAEPSPSPHEHEDVERPPR